MPDVQPALFRIGATSRRNVTRGGCCASAVTAIAVRLAARTSLSIVASHLIDLNDDRPRHDFFLLGYAVKRNARQRDSSRQIHVVLRRTRQLGCRDQERSCRGVLWI